MHDHMIVFRTSPIGKLHAIAKQNTSNDVSLDVGLSALLVNLPSIALLNFLGIVYGSNSPGLQPTLAFLLRTNALTRCFAPGYCQSG